MPRQKGRVREASPSPEKPRARWFRARAAWPWREAPVPLLLKAQRAAKLPTSSNGEKWRSVGPTNVAGRMTSLVVDPSNPDRILAGAAGGGVWRSDDAGHSWSQTWQKRHAHIGALALDPQNPRVVYCGTGDASRSVDTFGGVGLYKSEDWGRNWRHIARVERTGLPRRIGSIEVDPFDSQHIRLGGIGYERPVFGGLYVSRDGGFTWRRETFVSRRNYWCHAVRFHPTERNCLYCTVTARGAMSGIWRSTNGGKTWEHLTKGLPGSEGFGRTSLAIAPSDPHVLYALTSSEELGSHGRVLGVFRSNDGGDTWSKITDGVITDRVFQAEEVMWYTNVIAVHPKNPDHVICGGLDLYVSEDGGRTWMRATRWNARIDSRGYAHADHHALVMPASDPDRIYSANDGGVAVSMNAGQTWHTRSRGLTTTMFYDVDVAATDGRVFGGGSQDNGTLVTGHANPLEFEELLDGDGGWILYDPKDARHKFATYQWMNIFRFHGRRRKDVTPKNAPEEERGAIWMTKLAMDPEDARIVYAGSTRIWQTRDDGDSWLPISDHFDGSVVSAIEVAASDRSRIYAGTESGGFFRSEDGGLSWSPNSAGPEIPGFGITRIECHPRKADVIYITVAKWLVSHLFRSDDGGRTWVDLDGGKLPDAPYHAVVMRTDEPECVFVGGDAGVFASTDGGKTWGNFTGNLPPVLVTDLVYHEQDGTLTAATYGRGIWRIDVRPPISRSKHRWSSRQHRSSRRR